VVLTLLILTLFTSPEAPPSIASIEDLEPSAIGEIVLKGREHGIVESVTPDRGLDPPGVVRLNLTERPSAILRGCVRRKWTATFRHRPGVGEKTAILSDAFMTTEASLPTVSGCSNGEFAHVNPGMSVDEALSALRHLMQVRNGKAKVRFSCSDSTGSRLCRTPRTIRRELAKLPAWAVTKRDGKIEFWLGDRGQTVTAVSYSETWLDQVSVERRIPAPF
jgi:hypothetical protein